MKMYIYIKHNRISANFKIKYENVYQQSNFMCFIL